MLDRVKTDEEILAFDVSDEALEIAAGTVSDKANFTFGVCTANQKWVPGLITDAGEIISQNKTRHVRYWHKADIPSCAAHVRFRR